MVSRQLQDITGKLYTDEIKAYFEEWEDKLNQIMSEIDILWERIDSVEDAFKSMVDIKTNFTVKVLTIFSAFFLPLTLITSFYGMNVDFPSSDLAFIFSLLWLSTAFMLIIYLFLRRNWKF
jgi:magnesium transporter